ncbi:MAG: hypothetical protein JWO08_1480 [Verrucomicrobiaceae bacterium]|nr:hypothetical protein [Verrucomicrobiaceae bacterium]
MAIVLEANYAKKLGLPGYSSHQYSVSIRAEITDLSQIEQESSRLYELLQEAVDRSIQKVGFMPDSSTYGAVAADSSSSHNSHHRNSHRNGSQTSNSNGQRSSSQWRCSDKQSALIQKIVQEKNLDKADVERLATEMFGAGVRQLDRLQASGLIDELFVRHGSTSARNSGRPPSAARFQQRIATLAEQARSVSRSANGGNLL